MPWAPELFSAPVLQRLTEKLHRELVTVPFFEGLMTGELDALVGSFADEPELHHPVRGRIRGVHAFETYVANTQDWLSERAAAIEDVQYISARPHSAGEANLRLGGRSGRVDLPVAIVADRQPDGRISELRMYYSSWPLTGHHAVRPPILQPNPELREPGFLANYQRALAIGDVDSIVSTFEPDGYAREPAGGEYIHSGLDGLRAFYNRLFSDGGGIPLEHCAVVDDGEACALEYNVVRWGQTELPPQAGLAVYVRGESGKLAAARIYDDVDPPIS